VDGGSSTELSSLVSLLLSRCVTSANPHVRQAACVWLLAVVSKCSRYSEVQACIMSIQDAFISLLSETDGRHSSLVQQALSSVLYYLELETTQHVQVFTEAEKRLSRQTI